ncbi:MAG: glycerate kinase [Bacteroidetes bacterium]|nr:glycerate kinase [Bacteroidota bacterium]
MKVIIATDSFKDAADSYTVCQSIKNGWIKSNPLSEIHCFPLADGGEGLIDILKRYLEMDLVFMEVDDALRRKKTAQFLFSESKKMAIIEVAQAIGLQDLNHEERNPLYTSSYGVGEMIKKACKLGATEILIGLGGSATNDAGMGMANALGWRFLDENGKDCEPIGIDLIKVIQIVPPAEFIGSKVTFEILCDVNNPLFGPNGAAFIFAPQKGADSMAVKSLDNGLKHFYGVCSQLNMDVKDDLAGAGAAGGLGFGTSYFLGATLKSGIDLILKHAQIEKKMKESDLVITGEGSLDKQTLQGKLIKGVCQLANKYNKPVIALCGALNLSEEELTTLGLRAAFSIAQGPGSLRDALLDTEKNLGLTAFNIAQMMK